MKRLIYTLCLIIGCATLSEAKVLTGHKTRLTDNWLYLRGDIGNIWEAVRSSAASDVYKRQLQCHRCRRPGHELLPGPRVV